jgi:hypothetical protein
MPDGPRFRCEITRSFHHVVVLGFALAILAGPAWAARVDLSGLAVEATGNWKMKFKDDGSVHKCGPTARGLGMQFNADGTWTGYVGSEFVSGTWKQKGKGDRNVKIKTGGASESVLNQEIDDGVSACILSIPDGLPVDIRKVKLKGVIDKAGKKLKVKLRVEFRSQENGLFWDMRGDEKDTFTLKATFDLPAMGEL